MTMLAIHLCSSHEVHLDYGVDDDVDMEEPMSQYRSSSVMLRPAN